MASKNKRERPRPPFQTDSIVLYRACKPSLNLKACVNVMHISAMSGIFRVCKGVRL